ncbi:hypothetical protein RFA42_004344 [Vibrio vulnificus]|uniref:hypothetical protein n=1 Tax=Vibrio vulnificus TaxID=672 RepID=UPI00102A26A0|nr:hypothetical protein [Vibrio vulnificus]EKD7165536.1 hypothetical protein [Vibrio vulnificus]EKZ9203510.1 hypothetical protein [Vibrio vulnificus]MCA3975625.1 hypothetical protein [Vibrio vulnificus]MCU8251626.1 hypothetical protein [Vibrio vulnificus]RZP55083.1 hypothetical protein D8T47_22110 [Vibrio vulnificus]
MQSQNCYEYIKVGLYLRLLRSVNENFKKEDIKRYIENLIESLESVSFEVTLSSMSASSITSIVSEVDDDDEEKGEVNIGSALSRRIKNEFERVEFVVFSEAQTKIVYDLPQRRFNTDYLLNHPEKLLSEGVFEKLDDIAQHDIRSSCRCLLFGEPTAVAFHILRATESTLKSFYFHHRKRDRLQRPMWANMVDQLKAKTRNKPPKHLLSTLDIIRTVYRNPTQHPEATYELDSAQDLLGVCLDAINQMGKELT